MLGRRHRSLLAALLMALPQLSWTSAGLAEDKSSTEGAPPIVRVLFAGDEARVSRLLEALLDPFRRAQIELRFDRTLRIEPASLLTPVAVDDTSAAALAFDLSRPDQAVLYLTDRARSRVFVRKFELSKSFDEVQLERLVVAARSSVSAILAGQSIGIARKEYERSLAPPAPASERQALPRPITDEAVRTLSIASRYEAEWLSGATPSHGPGLMLLWNKGRFGFGAAVGGRLPWRYVRGEIGVRLVTFNTLLSAELRQVLVRDWVASASLGVGLDATLVQPLALRAGVAQADGPSWVLDPFSRAQLGLTRAWTGFWLGGFAGLDLEWIRARYTIDRDGRRETLLTPNLLRPLLALGFGTIW